MIDFSLLKQSQKSRCILKQSEKSRSILKDGSRFSGLFWKGKTHCLITKETWYPEITDSAKTQKDHWTEFDLQMLVVSDNGSFIETVSLQ